MKKNFLFLALIGILIIFLLGGCVSQQQTGNQTPAKQTTEQPSIEQPNVKLSTENYIVDDKGKTLYLFTKDVKGDSKCIDACLKIWPVFYREKISVSSGLNSSDFGTITRTDGNKQTTYKHMPLYYYINDTARGDTNGQGVNDEWFIVEPAAKVLSTTPQTQNASSSLAPAIKVASFPQSAHGDTIITIKWEVTGGTAGEISNTAIIWGYNSAGENVSDYPKATVIQTGKTPKEFSAGINIPSSGALYFRVHAIVDGSDIFSPENQISIIQQTSGY